MSTYRELTYMAIDQLKQASDDSYFEAEHIVFLLDKYRALLLKQRYGDIRKSIPLSNYSTITLDLTDDCTRVISVASQINYLDNTTNSSIVRTDVEIPSVIALNHNFGVIKVNNASLDSSELQFKGDFSFVSPERFNYVGENKWLKKMVYATLGVDNYVYLKSGGYDLSVLPSIQITALFENPKDLTALMIPAVDDFMDMKYPLEEALVPPLLEMVIKDLLPAIYRPSDEVNNSNDDLDQMNVKK